MEEVGVGIVVLSIEPFLKIRNSLYRSLIRDSTPNAVIAEVSPPFSIIPNPAPVIAGNSIVTTGINRRNLYEGFRDISIILL